MATIGPRGLETQTNTLAAEGWEVVSCSAASHGSFLYRFSMVTVILRREAAVLATLVFLLGLPLLSRAAVALADPGGPARPQSVAEVIPPPVPEAENAAPLYRAAVTALEAEKVWSSTLALLAGSVDFRADPKATVDWLKLPQANNRNPTQEEVRAEFARRLDGPAVAEALRLVARASALPKCRFDVDYAKGGEAPLPHHAELRALSRFLGTVAATATQRGAAPTAWACTLWQLRLAEALRDEPFLISPLVRGALLEMAALRIETVADGVAVGGDAIPCIDRLLDSMDDPQPWCRGVDGMRLVFGDWFFHLPPDKIQQLGNLTSEATGKPLLLSPEELAAEQAAFAAALVRIATLLEKPYWSAKGELDALRVPPTTPVAVGLVMALRHVGVKAAGAQATARLARLGLRLKQYKEAHGTYPADLAALDLAGIPPEKQQDPFTGKPLCYRTEGQGFVLYSAWWDGVDNGGSLHGGRANEGDDWGWRAAQ